MELAAEGITGTISPCIANLTSLTTLQLSNNSFHGSIPSELGLLSELKNLNLSMNSLEGNIPPELSSCSQLEILDLHSNSLQGEIPDSLNKCIHLQEINLSRNNLQGGIPSAFEKLPKLQTLVLARNRLTGDIPPFLGSSSSLRYVDLGYNALTGSIPESLANSSSLQVLRLMSNSLSGELPKSLFNTSSLIAICLQQNSFIGSIPTVTAKSSPIKYLNIRNNYISGTIPSSLANLSSLLSLRLAVNNLVGNIPESLGHIQTLEKLALSVNNLSGPVPPSLFNISSLTFLGMANNSLMGRLPSDIGYTLPKIQALILSTNKFAGPIPASLLNAYHLEMLYLGNNSFIGFIPFFGSLPNLKELDVSYNMLEPGNWSFMTSLSNCSRLTKLMLDGNSLQGNLPSSIGNLSSNLEALWLRDNKFFGPIQSEIGNLKNLNRLYVDYNDFTGNIPPTIGNMNKLVFLSFAQNKLSGHIPDVFGNLLQLTDLKLDANNFSGRIPESIGQCTQLQILNLAHNSLVGNIPRKIFKISSLSEEMDLSHNYLSGEIPEEVGNLIHLSRLSLSKNKLSGKIPSSLGQCVVLEYLEIHSNCFVGGIPQSFVNLINLKKMDVSRNNLSGKIPEFLAALSLLERLNLSFNSFDGVLPMGGVFDMDAAVSIEGNDHLCTSILTEGIPFCSVSVDRKRKLRILVLVLEILIPSIIVVIIILSYIVRMYRRKGMQANPFEQISEHMKKITYQDIVKATDRFNSKNLIGSGSFGTVYKGKLDPQEDEVAIKIFKLDIYGAQRSFDVECEALRNIRHRNLVKIITLCSSVDPSGADFKALVFQYMANGNLDTWLHPKAHESIKRKTLTFNQRINIALDIAFALDYLHNQCASQLVHCDLKPSNILLDLDMIAYVSDFGLARFLNIMSYAYEGSSKSLNGLKGSIGYIPPEYGISEAISTNGDVYSFGVLLLEMITGSRPTDEKFNDSTSLREHVARAFPNNTDEIVDPRMLQGEISITTVMQKCIIPLVRISLCCSAASPKDRWEMGQVSAEILKIKHIYSSIHETKHQQNEYGISEVISTNGDVYSFGMLLLEMITESSPTDKKFNDGTILREHVAGAFPDNTYEIVDPRVKSTEQQSASFRWSERIGLCCSAASPKDRWEMGQVSAEILKIKHMYSSIYDTKHQQNSF
uniref:Receptor kinase-like protein Xa21 n=2 Tax=Leersia perrieri TaxID=77586 RepID=A0A0D9WRK6_9ORYZ